MSNSATLTKIDRIHLIEHSQLQCRFKSVLLALESFSGPEGCFPSLKRLAAMVGVAKSTLCERLRQMAQLGLIEREERHRNDGSQTSSLYQIAYAKLRGIQDLWSRFTKGGGKRRGKSRRRPKPRGHRPRRGETREGGDSPSRDGRTGLSGGPDRGVREPDPVNSPLNSPVRENTSSVVRTSVAGDWAAVVHTLRQEGVEGLCIRKPEFSRVLPWGSDRVRDVAEWILSKLDAGQAIRDPFAVLVTTLQRKTDGERRLVASRAIRTTPVSAQGAKLGRDLDALRRRRGILR